MLLAWLGVSSCRSGNVNIALEYGTPNPDAPVEYGTPTAVFELKATVTSPEGKPIPGAEVSLLPDEYQDPDSMPKAVTDEEGRARLEQTTFPHADYFRYRVKDIDGDQNGAWQSKTDSVYADLQKEGQGGDAKWYDGKTTKEVTVVLRPQEKQK